MRNYTRGIFLLVLMMLTLTGAAFKLNQYARTEKAELHSLKTRIKEKEASFESFRRKIEENNGSAIFVETFITAWDPFLMKGGDASGALNAIVGLSLRNAVAVCEKSAQRSQLGDKESILLTLKVVGKFERIFNWLGEVEESFPQAKIKELELSTENRNATLKLGLEIPTLS